MAFASWELACLTVAGWALGLIRRHRPRHRRGVMARGRCTPLGVDVPSVAKPPEWFKARRAASVASRPPRRRPNAVVPGYPKCCKRCDAEYVALRRGAGHLIDERIEAIGEVLWG